jgi:uncharacterized cupredoxin-like copper-binding protein
MSARPFPGALLILAGLLAGCKSERSAPGAATPPATPSESPAASQPTIVTVTATEFALDLPAQIPAGAITLHLVNNGKQLHQAQVIRLEDGKTMADFAQAMKQNGPPPSWMKFAGGPNGTAPGNASDATTVLTPGNYAVLCFIPGPDLVPHVMSGMIRPFEVTAATSAAAAQLPVADDTIRLADYSFLTTQPLTQGHHTILVENTGPQTHEIVLLKLAPGKSVGEFAQWAGVMKGPPPAMPLGGVTALESGGSGTFSADLTPGDYALICFVPDAKDGKPHFAHGMMQQFKVI